MKQSRNMRGNLDSREMGGMLAVYTRLHTVAAGYPGNTVNFGPFIIRRARDIRAGYDGNY